MTFIQSAKARWHRVPVEPPLSVMAGDKVVLGDSGLIEQQRQGTDGHYHTIDTRQVSFVDAEPVTEQPFESDFQITEAFFTKGPPMAAQITLTHFTIDQTTNVITAFFSDGQSQEWTDYATFKTWAEDQVQLSMAKTLLLISAAGRSDSGTDLSESNGSSVTIDPLASVQFSFTGIPGV